MTREFHDIHREEVRGDALYKRYEDEEAKQSRKRGEEDILYDTQKMNPSSSESDDDNGDSPEEEEKVNDSLFQQSQAQFQSVEEDSPPKKAKKSRKMKETILYDAQKMIPSSSESDDDDDSPEEEEKVNDSLFQQSQAQFQSVDATSDDSDIQSQSLLKWKYIFCTLSLCGVHSRLITNNKSVQLLARGGAQWANIGVDVEIVISEYIEITFEWMWWHGCFKSCR